MTDTDETEPYRVEAVGNLFQVVDTSGSVIVSCGDPANAGQYVALLNQAYCRGYKTGYRNAIR